MDTLTIRGLLAIAFRQKQRICVAFLCISGFIIVALSIRPNLYDIHMKILVKQSRIDPLVTPDPEFPVRVGNLTEQDLTSEAELLRSRDVLERASIACNIPKSDTNALAWIPVVNAFARTTASKPKPDPITVSQAARELEENIKVAPVENSNVISVAYSSENPTQAACLLRAVGRFYLEKHLAVHRPSGTFEFFRQEAEHYKGELESIEEQLASFGRQEQLVTEGTEKEISVRKLGDYKSSLIDTKTAIAEARARIRELEGQAKTTEPRVQRTIRTAPNEGLRELQAQLATLETRRTEMLGKFVPTYKPLQNLQQQIQGLKNTMAEIQKQPFVEETTDANPANDWLKLELAKARSDLASLQAGMSGRQRAVEQYGSMILDIDQKDIKRADLMRTHKTAEEKYLLYLRKEEEARIDQELDRQRILNVAIAEEPAVPILPQPPPIPMKFGFVLAGLLSLCLGFVTDYYDRSFRTPEEVERYLGLPLLAAIPFIDHKPDQGMDHQPGQLREATTL